MKSEEIEIIEPKEKAKVKNPRRVAAGRKGAEARIRNTEQRKKELDSVKKENINLKITKDDNDENNEKNNLQTIKDNNKNKRNYIPIFIIIGCISGIGLYAYKYKRVKQEKPIKQEIQEKPITGQNPRREALKQEETTKKETSNYQW